MLAYLDSTEKKAAVQRHYRDRTRDGVDHCGVLGTFAGLLLGHGDLRAFPAQLGWPVWFADAASWIFEGLPAREARRFGSTLLEAIPVGADLEGVGRRLALDVVARFSSTAIAEPARSKAEDRQQQAIVDAADSLMDLLELGRDSSADEEQKAYADAQEQLALLKGAEVFHASAVAVFSRALEFATPPATGLSHNIAMHWLLRNGVLDADQATVARWGRARLLKYVREAPTRSESSQDFMRFLKSCQRTISVFSA